MNYYYVTGTSSGIGKAFAELLLQDKNNFVYGISRTNSIDNKNYKHIFLDLRDIESVKKFEFPEFNDAESVCLVNNAIYPSEITHFARSTHEDIVGTYNVNIISPALLINNYLKKYQTRKFKKVILNISSGAAKIPIESWAAYCSSKSALAMLSDVIDVEQKLKDPDERVYIFSVPPGVVDTKAQERIRNTSPEDFSGVGRFIEYKEKNQLASPDDIAKKLAKIIEDAEKIQKVDVSVKEI